MAIIKNPITVGGAGGGSADVVNGLIEQYKAYSGTVDAGTFVEFVNRWSELMTVGDEQSWKNEPTSNYGRDIKLLEDGKIVEAWAAMESSYNRYRTSVSSISDDGTIITGSVLEVGYGYYDGVQTPRVVVLSPDRVVFCYYEKASSSSSSHTNYLKMAILGIDGLNITTEVDPVTMATNSGFVTNFQVARVDSNRFVLAETYNNKVHLYEVEDDNTIIEVSSVGGVKDGNVDIKPFGENKLIVASESETGAPLLVKELTVSGNSLTTSNSIIITKTYQYTCTVGNNIVVMPCSENLVVVGFAMSSDKATYANRQPYAVAINTSADSWTVGDILQVNTDYVLSYGSIAGTELTDNRVFMVSGSGGNMVGNILEVSDTTLTKLPPIPISGSSSSNTQCGSIARLINTGEILIVHGHDIPMARALKSIDPTTVRPAANPQAIEGLTKTACTTETAGDVYVLDAGGDS